MKKLKLDLNSVRVESFEILSGGARSGSVRGHHGLDTLMGEDVAMESENPAGSCWASCPTMGCGTCYKTCWVGCEEEPPLPTG